MWEPAFLFCTVLGAVNLGGELLAGGRVLVTNVTRSVNGQNPGHEGAVFVHVVLQKIPRSLILDLAVVSIVCSVKADVGLRRVELRRVQEAQDTAH